MSLKQNIDHGEALLKNYSDTLTTLEDIEKNYDNEKAVRFLISIQKIEFEDRVANVKKRLAKIQKEYIFQFEKDSAEANSGLEPIIEAAKKYVGQEPLSITNLLLPLIKYHFENKDNFSQEERNDLYFKMKGHINFLKKTYKK